MLAAGPSNHVFPSAISVRANGVSGIRHDRECVVCETRIHTIKWLRFASYQARTGTLGWLRRARRNAADVADLRAKAEANRCGRPGTTSAADVENAASSRGVRLPCCLQVSSSCGACAFPAPAEGSVTRPTVDILRWSERVSTPVRAPDVDVWGTFHPRVGPLAGTSTWALASRVWRRLS